MRPPEVLDQQAALIDFLDARYYERAMEGFLTDMKRKGKIAAGTSGTEFTQTLRISLSVAQPFHVQSEMMPLIRAGAMDLDDDDYIAHSVLPAESGFLIFNEPWVTTDVWGKEVKTHAFAWRNGSAPVGGITQAGIWFTAFTDITDPDQTTRELFDSHGEEALRAMGRYHVNHIAFYRYNSPVGPATVMSDEEYAKFATTGEGLQEGVENQFRMVVAIFRLLTQVIVEVADAPVDRATVRRMTRKNLPARVQTVKLRRKVRVRENDETVGEGHVDWSHQWAVRGHWAWRACSAHHDHAEEYDKGYRTRVYIAPYLKGPEDKPILITEKVWGLAQ